MQRSRRDLLDEFLDLIGEPNDSNARNLAERGLNQSLQRLWLKHTWRSFMRPEPYTLSTVINQRSYALPPDFGRVSSREGIIRNITQPREIYPADPQRLSRDNPRQGTSNEIAGIPSAYYIDGSWGVATQPASTGQALEVVSSAAADTAVRVFVEGENAAGVWQQVQVTLVGTTPVAVGTFRFVQTLGKTYPEGVTATSELSTSAGTISLQVAPAGAVLGTLAPYEASRELQVITFWPMPDAVYTIAIPVYRQPRLFVYDSDPCPNHWGPALIEDLLISWRINQGKFALNSGVPRPDLADLIAHDNLGRLPLRRQPFDGTG